MRRTMGPWYARRTNIFIIVALTLVISVVVYQQVSQREDAIPGSAGGFDAPGDRGAQATGDPIAAWAGDAAAGDYAAAQQRMDENTFLFGSWKAEHERFQSRITGYQILDQQTVGQTTTATVKFTLADNDVRCLPVLLNESTHRIFIDKSYNNRCAAQP